MTDKALRSFHKRVTIQASLSAVDVLRSLVDRRIAPVSFGVKSFKTAREIFSSMKRLNYDIEDNKTYPVSSFQVIDQQGFAVSVFIELDNEAIAAKEAFQRLILKKMSKEEFDTRFKLTFNQRIITVPKYSARLR